MSVVPTVRVDPKPTLYEKLKRFAVAGAAERRRRGRGLRRRAPRRRNPWIIAVLVALAAFMEVLDTTIANVVLPYIAGGMGVSEDEASWVVTTYLVSNAISLTASPLLSPGGSAARPSSSSAWGCSALARCCAASPGTSTRCCCSASCKVWRRRHGAGGAIILADSFPPKSAAKPSRCSASRWSSRRWSARRSAAGSPTTYAWRWCFLINGPVGLAAIALIACPHRARGQTRKHGSTGPLRCGRLRAGRDVPRRPRGRARPRPRGRLVRLELHRQRSRLFAALAFVLMIPWELSRSDPMIDMRMVGTRQFGACFLVMGATGAILSRRRSSCRSWCRRISATPRPGPASCCRRAAS